jgi:hypothetical protein
MKEKNYFYKFNYKIKKYSLKKLNKNTFKIAKNYFIIHDLIENETNLLYDFYNILNKFEILEEKVYYIPSIFEYINQNKIKFNKDEINFLYSFYQFILDKFFGEFNIQIGLCYGKNKFVNSLEFHRSNEIIISLTPQVLVLGDIRKIEILKQNNETNSFFKYDYKNLTSFFIPPFKIVELYSTTLHFAPISLKDENFYSIIILPEKTNLPLKEKNLNENKENITTTKNNLNDLLFANNKLLFTHKDSPQYKLNATVGFHTKERLKLIDL